MTQTAAGPSAGTQTAADRRARTNGFLMTDQTFNNDNVVIMLALCSYWPADGETF